MQLLGTYNSNLASFQYQELLALLTAALSQGDLSSGSAFDKTTLLQLEAQATSFANLPLATAGTRALDESMLQPTSLLQARFAALLSEVSNFTTRSEALLAHLRAETDLLDQLLAADHLRNWVATLPTIPESWSLAWDFLTGQGKTSVLLPPIDPANGVAYTSELRVGSVLDVTTGVVSSGLLPPADVTTIAPKNLIWTPPAGFTTDPLYGPDMSWAELTLVNDVPAVIYSSHPDVRIILPLNGGTSSVITVSGAVPGGALPTYLRLLFYPRINQASGVASNGTPFTLSQYSVDPDTVSVFSTDSEGNPTEFFNEGVDYTVDQTGSITPVNIGTNVQITARFSENFPAYQCSVDQNSWSDIHMLDPNRIFRDDETSFYPLDMQNGMFPLTDETGLPTGLYFSLNGALATEYTLLVTTPGASAFGPQCQLEVDIHQPSYCNTLSIKPFSAFPAKLISVQLQGLADTVPATVFNGSVLVDKALQIRFPRQLVTSVLLTFVQENYTITEYQDLSLDSLRRSTMAKVESSLPFSLGHYIPPVITTKRGYQYALGFEEIVAQDVAPTLPGVVVQGPTTIAGCPIAVRLDAQLTGTCAVYLCYRALNAAGVLVDSNDSGVPITPGTPLVIPYTGGTVLANIASLQVSLRFVLRDASSVFSRYNLQAVLR